jgi:hypothetical protein
VLSECLGVGGLGLGLSLQVVFILRVCGGSRHGGEPHCRLEMSCNEGASLHTGPRVLQRWLGVGVWTWGFHFGLCLY